MVFSHFEVLHILIRSDFHFQLPLSIMYKFFLLPEALCVILRVKFFIHHFS